MSSRDIPGTSRPLELDPNPTAKEHAEFERLEREHPNAEVPEKKIPVPPRPQDALEGKHDVQFLLLFIIFAAVFLLILLFGGGQSFVNARCGCFSAGRLVIKVK
ncbi:MAG TPA: hypothetical protein O0X23_04410 [Methanocorpusculum sp.]|nr:hypothetical protein [Methanocorpusculum sp.]